MITNIGVLRKSTATISYARFLFLRPSKNPAINSPPRVSRTMTSKTWFLPPDFTFLPDGQIALGRIIPAPQQPTITLASLADHPNITLPEVKSIIEKNHSFSPDKNRSFGLGLFAKFLDSANLDDKVDISWYKKQSFSAVDHVVRAYSGAFTSETLKAIVALESVRRHINSGRFGKRYVYVISGLRVVQQSITVSEEQGKTTSVSLEGSGSVVAAGAPIELGGNISGERSDSQNHSYETAPGIVFAYRLHVIRPKSTGEEAELFSDRTAFFSGGAEDDDQEEEMEIVEADATVLQQDLDLEPDDYDERRIEDEEESYIVFSHTSEEK